MDTSFAATFNFVAPALDPALALAPAPALALAPALDIAPVPATESTQTPAPIAPSTPTNTRSTVLPVLPMAPTKQLKRCRTKFDRLDELSQINESDDENVAMDDDSDSEEQARKRRRTERCVERISAQIANIGLNQPVVALTRADRIEVNRMLNFDVVEDQNTPPRLIFVASIIAPSTPIRPRVLYPNSQRVYAPRRISCIPRRGNTDSIFDDDELAELTNSTTSVSVE